MPAEPEAASVTLRKISLEVAVCSSTAEAGDDQIARFTVSMNEVNQGEYYDGRRSDARNGDQFDLWPGVARDGSRHK